MIKTKDGYVKLIDTTYSGSANYLLQANGGAWAVHTGRNDDSNKIVRTDASGYLLTGWINTTSGDMGTGKVTRIYCSNDGYIRYKTPANFFSTLANDENLISITIGSLNRKLTVDYSNYSGYSNYLAIHDIRGTNPTPNDFDDKKIKAWFNNTEVPSSDWWSGITVKGWTDGYAVWLLAGYSSTTSTESHLYYRRGLGTSWGSWKQLAFTTDNVASATTVKVSQHTTNNTNYPLVWANEPNTSSVNSDLYKSWNHLYYNPATRRLTVAGGVSTLGTVRIKCTTGNYQEGLTIQNADSTWCTIRLGNTEDSGTTENTWSIHRTNNNNFSISRNSSNGANGLAINKSGNVGIGYADNNIPKYKLSVNGTLRANDVFVNTGDATLKIYTGRTTDGKNDGNICFQTSIDATDGQTHSYPTEYQNRCNISLQPRGGQVYIGTNPSGGDTKYKLYVNGRIYASEFVRANSSDSYLLLGGGGHKAVSDFMLRKDGAAPDSAEYGFGFWNNVGSYISFAASGWGGQLKAQGEILYYRYIANSKPNGWHQIAKITDNVYSATKLQTARTIWGLSFDGTGNVSGELFGAGGAINLEFTNEVNSYNGYLYLNHRGNGAGGRGTTSHVIMCANGGNVGIGTASPSQRLDVNGTARGNGLASNNIRIECDNNGVFGSRGNEINDYNGPLQLQYNTSQQLHLCYGGGNVGIGTLTPAYKLDVNGDIRSNDAYLRSIGSNYASTLNEEFNIDRSNLWCNYNAYLTGYRYVIGWHDTGPGGWTTGYGIGSYRYNENNWGSMNFEVCQYESAQSRRLQLELRGKDSTVWTSGNIQATGLVQGSGFVKSGSSDSYVLLGGGGHKALDSIVSSFVLYAYYLINITPSGVSYSKINGNYNFISRASKDTKVVGRGLLYLNLPSGYSKHDVIITGNGHHKGSNWRSPCYLAILYDLGSTTNNYIGVMTADDDTANDNCFATVAFLLFK